MMELAGDGLLFVEVSYLHLDRRSCLEQLLSALLSHALALCFDLSSCHNKTGATTHARLQHNIDDDRLQLPAIESHRNNKRQSSSRNTLATSKNPTAKPDISTPRRINDSAFIHQDSHSPTRRHGHGNAHTAAQSGEGTVGYNASAKTGFSGQLAARK